MLRISRYNMHILSTYIYIYVYIYIYTYRYIFICPRDGVFAVGAQCLLVCFIVVLCHLDVSKAICFWVKMHLTWFLLDGVVTFCAHVCLDFVCVF